jgi:cell division protein ZapB
MEADLKALEGKLAQFIALCQHLKSENHSLRQELAQSQSDSRLLKDNMAQAGERLQSIIEKLPEGTL